MTPKTAIIGIGNPILTDDSVGVKVARVLAERLESRPDIEVMELYAGGIRLMDAMVGYDRAVVIDAMETGSSRPGTICRLELADIAATRNTFSTHDTNLATALEMGKMLGLALPREVRIWGIEAEDVETFSDELTREVAQAVPEVVEEILRELGGLA